NNSIHPAIAHFPPIILDRHLNCMPGGQNVFDYYQSRDISITALNKYFVRLLNLVMESVSPEITPYSRPS
ncbi:MAG: hypothetical protein ABII72_01300, partial [Parcubacteria group bacterium]